MSRRRKDDDDDSEEPDLAQQQQRPPDNAFNQQRVAAWNPILDPVWTVAAFLLIGATLVPAGFKIQAMSDEIVELKRTYDAYDDPSPICGIKNRYNLGRVCKITITVPKYMTPPILIHYELENFHQNHRTYFRSRDPEQLLGRVKGQNPIYDAKCQPLNRLGGIQLNPCGLIANTFFNDVFELGGGTMSADGNELVMIEEGIAWESDRRYLFSQPDGFRYQLCPDQELCDESCCDGNEWSCQKPHRYRDGKCYRYFYPNDDTTQYLHETYEGVISPLDGVTDEHFIVWMRVAALPTFRKLYGYIEHPIAAGTNLTFVVHANYVVQTFKGRKSLIISTNNIFGGKNNVVGPCFYVGGYFCMVVGIFFAVKHLIWPRKVADRKYLHHKQN